MTSLPGFTVAFGRCSGRSLFTFHVSRFTSSLPRPLLQVPTPDVLVGPGAAGAAVGAEADDLVGLVVAAGAVVLVVVAPRILMQLLQQRLGLLLGDLHQRGQALVVVRVPIVR